VQVNVHDGGLTITEVVVRCGTSLNNSAGYSLNLFSAGEIILNQIK